MRAPSSSLTLLIWGACSNPRGSGFEPLISRVAAGWQLGVPDFLHLQDLRAGGRTGPRVAGQ
jgi:hypothetical protein